MPRKKIEQPPAESSVLQPIELAALENPVEQSAPPSIELAVLEKSLLFRWNFAEVKTRLNEILQKYASLVVNDDNVFDMEKTHREIATLRIKLDRFRIDTKKILNEPAMRFDIEVKELQAAIETVEKPIKDQLDKYEAARVEKRETVLLEYARSIATEKGLRDEFFATYKIASRLTIRSISDAAAKREIEAELDELLARQGKADTAAEEARRQEEAAQAFAKQKADLIISLCKANSDALVLRTPVTLDEIKHLTDQAELSQIPTIILTECTKRQKMEQAAAEPPNMPIRREEAAFICTRDLPPAVTSAPQTGSNFRPQMPVPPPWATPQPPTAGSAPQLFDVKIRFPEISIPQAADLKSWTAERGLKFEVISQEPVKGA